MASNNLPLMRLTFSKRWEQVGQRPDLEELLDPEPLEGHEANFCRVAASQRLIYLDHVKIQPPAAPEEPALDFSMTVKPNAKPKPKKKILRNRLPVYFFAVGGWILTMNVTLNGTGVTFTYMFTR
eukprot:symbB.v1.2.029967.t1/scaffold3329.1/size58948/2